MCAGDVLQNQGGKARDIVGANGSVVIERQDEVQTALIIRKLLNAGQTITIYVSEFGNGSSGQGTLQISLL